MKKIFASPDNHELLLYDNLRDEDNWELEDRVGTTRFRGRLIGLGSSKRDEHNHPNPVGSHSMLRCAACRWSEIYVFEITQPRTVHRFCVYTLGPSVVTTENTRVNVRWATSGFEVIEFATVRRGDRGAPYLPAAFALALAMAANVNDDIADAYVNRAVA